MAKKYLTGFQVLIVDIFIIFGSFFLGFLVRFDFTWSNIPMMYIERWLSYAWIYCLVSAVIFIFCRLYSIIWRYFGLNESIRVLLAVSLSAVTNWCGSVLTGNRMPMGVYLVAYGLTVIGMVGVRAAYRVMVLKTTGYYSDEVRANKKNVMIIGAGSAGHMAIRDIQRSDKVNMDIKCIIDDNASKKGRYLEGILIVGGRDMILAAAQKYKIDTILIAIPSASTSVQRDILEICKHTECELKILPGVYQLVDGTVSVGSFRDVKIEDLLGREPIKVNMDEIMDYVSEKTILVTGGGGSIGSELCRQIAGHKPKQLIILDIYENNAYDIQQELIRKYPNLNLVVIIASVRDNDKIEKVFAEYRPDLVFHAAAHKHVPLMEDAPCEAVKNNVFGTYNVARAAIEYEAKKFVLISTDKAVNPTNIMGATKRMCEMVVQTLGKTTDKTSLVAVRFGNVLGSNGSVIPLFKKQIEEGGPVTVTHPDIIRYFMTIQEAVSLVLQAGAYAKGGEIYILNMGAPVKIDDLARNMIRLSGYKPDVDIEIKYTGLRPGEKLYEELLMNEEGKKKTANDLIYIGKPLDIVEDFPEKLEALYKAAYENVDDMKDRVAEIVRTYRRNMEE